MPRSLVLSGSHPTSREQAPFASSFLVYRNVYRFAGYVYDPGPTIHAEAPFRFRYRFRFRQRCHYRSRLRRSDQSGLPSLFPCPFIRFFATKGHTLTSKHEVSTACQIPLKRGLSHDEFESQGNLVGGDRVDAGIHRGNSGTGSLVQWSGVYGTPRYRTGRNRR